MYRCKICGNGYRELTLLMQHFGEVHKFAAERVQCPICAKSYTIQSSLNVHMNVHTDKRFQCDLCQKYFIFKRALRMHLKKLLPVTQDICICDICGSSFRNEYDLYGHIRGVHNAIGRFQCNECPKRFPGRISLAEHLLQHTGERPYKCKKCFKSFASHRTFRKHKAEHNCVGFTCKICQKVLLYKYSFIEHMRLHAGQKEFKCRICTKEFVSSSALNCHIKRCALKITNRMFHCDICTQGFNVKIRLDKHKLEIHGSSNKVKCIICKLMVSHIGKHMESHNDGPYACELCPKRYPSGRTLYKYNMRSHRVVQSFACTRCDKTYNKLGNLKRHSMKEHKIEPKKLKQS